MRNGWVWGVLGFLAIGHGGFCQSADEILARTLTARGGAEAFAKIEAIRVTGTLQFAEGKPGALIVLAKRPSNFRLELVNGSDVFTQGYDGHTAWQMTAGEHAQAPTALSGSDAAHVIEQAVNAIGGPLVETGPRGTKVEFMGHDAVSGKDTFKLKLTQKDGAAMFAFIDAATNLEIREELLRDPSPLIEESLEDYRRFGGLLFPCLFISNEKGSGSKARLHVDAMEINPKLEDGVFRLPGK